MHNLNQALRLDGGTAEITERNNALTFLDDLNTAATSGSRTTAILPPDIRPPQAIWLRFTVVEAIFGGQLLLPMLSFLKN